MKPKVYPVYMTADMAQTLIMNARFLANSAKKRHDQGGDAGYLEDEKRFNAMAETFEKMFELSKLREQERGLHKTMRNLLPVSILLVVLLVLAGLPLVALAQAVDVTETASATAVVEATIAQPAPIETSEPVQPAPDYEAMKDYVTTVLGYVAVIVLGIGVFILIAVVLYFAYKSLPPQAVQEVSSATADAVERGFKAAQTEVAKTPTLKDDMAVMLTEPFVNAVVARLRAENLAQVGLYSRPVPPNTLDE